MNYQDDTLPPSCPLHTHPHGSLLSEVPSSLNMSPLRLPHDAQPGSGAALAALLTVLSSHSEANPPGQ